MNKVEEAMAAQVLAKGALGLGESHDTPEGRELVRNLLEKRRVSHLFIEFGSYSNTCL